MTDLRRIRMVQEDVASPLCAAPVVAPSDPDLDLLLARIRRVFHVRAVIVGLSGGDAAIPAAEGRSLACDDEPGLRICASLTLGSAAGPRLGLLILADTGLRRMSEREMRRLTRFASEVAALVARRRDAAAIAALRGRVEAQDRLIEEQAAALAHSRKVFERSSAAARIGVWECTLPGETLYWTDGV